MRTSIHRDSNWVAVIPIEYISIPPIYLPNNYPILMVDMRRAYIVPYYIINNLPSIFLGHMLHASMSIGRVLSSAIMWMRTVSAKQK